VGLAVVSGDAAGLPPLSLPVWACRLDLDQSHLIPVSSCRRVDVFLYPTNVLMISSRVASGHTSRTYKETEKLVGDPWQVVDRLEIFLYGEVVGDSDLFRRRS